MTNRVWYKSPEMIVGLSALVVSLVAVFVGIYSAYIDRAYARASVWPRLEIYRSFSNEVKSFRYGVTNSGTGPAIIKYVAIKDRDEYIHNWRDIEELNHKNIKFVQSHIHNRIIPPQQVINPIKISSTDVLTTFIDRESQDITISACYCSIYDECWTIDRRNSPTEVESCAIDEKLRFLQ